MRNLHHRSGALGALLALAILSGAAGVDPPAAPPAEDPAGEEQTKQAPPPSLDELLELDDPGAKTTTGAEEVAEQDAQAELQRRLDEEAVGSAFEQALQTMSLVADRLDVEFDTGLGTQRAQEEVLSRLEFLIQEAKKQQNSGSSSGGASSSSSASNPKPEPGKQGGSPENGGERSDGAASDATEGDPPAPRHGDINTIFDESRTEWGSLPQRIRDMLLQGRKEKFSSLYERLTREYYRRLAEEGSP